MAKPFQKLRARMVEYDLKQAELAKKLGVGARTISDRMNAHMPWSADAMYRIMEMLEIPVDQMHVYFPKDGRNEPGCMRMKAAHRGKLSSVQGLRRLR